MRSQSNVFLLVALSVSLAACGGGDPAGPGTVTVDEVTVAPSALTLLLDETEALTATPRANGQPVTGRTISWSSSDAQVASVDASGTVRGVRAGTATISATVDGRKGDVPVNVRNPVPVATSLTPASADAGASNLTVTVAGSGFANSATVSWNGTAQATTWVSRTQLSATIPASALQSEGAATVTVTNPAPGGGASGPLSFTISPAAVASVVLDVDEAELVPQQTRQLVAEVRDAAGQVLTGRSVEWSSGALSVATVTSTGVVTAVSPGEALITATSEGQSATATITVLPGAVVTSAGGQVNEGVVAVTVPAGALAAPTAITIEANTTPPAHPQLVPGSAFDLGPDGATFAQPVTVRIGWTAAQEAGRTPSAFSVHRWSGTAWVALGNASNDPVARTASGTTSQFSTFALIQLPLNAVPTLASLSPSSAEAGAEALDVTLTGTGYVASSQVLVNGDAVPTTFVSAQELVAQLDASLLSAAGTLTLRVRNPAPGGGDSEVRTFAVHPPSGSLITVTSTADNVGNASVCTLRAAVQAANTNVAVDACPAGHASRPDVVQLASGTYQLSVGLELTDAAGLTLLGEGAGNTIVDGGGAVRLVEAKPGSGPLRVERLTMANGVSPGTFSYGGAIQSYSRPTFINQVTFTGNSASRGGAIAGETEVTVEVHNSIFTGNHAEEGGAIDFQHALIVTGSVFTGNTATRDGGAVETSSGSMTISESRFEQNSAAGDGGALRTSVGTITVVGGAFIDNTAGGEGGAIRMSGAPFTISGVTFDGNSTTGTGDGGAIRLSGAELQVTGSTFSNNTTERDGGAIRTSGGSIEITNSTFHGNSAQPGNQFTDPGGSALRAGGSTTRLVHVTITGGARGGGIQSSSGSGSVTFVNSIIADNVGGNCVGAGTRVSEGGNVTTDATCNMTHQSDVQTANVLLGALQNNGGATATRLPAAGSPAIGAALSVACTATDQRGVARPQGTACDAGAAEVQSAAAALRRRGR